VAASILLIDQLMSSQTASTVAEPDRMDVAHVTARVAALYAEIDLLLGKRRKPDGQTVKLR
jgi:hypothetical protein